MPTIYYADLEISSGVGTSASPWNSTQLYNASVSALQDYDTVKIRGIIPTDYKMFSESISANNVTYDMWDDYAPPYCMSTYFIAPSKPINVTIQNMVFTAPYSYDGMFISTSAAPISGGSNLIFKNSIFSLASYPIQGLISQNGANNLKFYGCTFSYAGQVFNVFNVLMGSSTAYPYYHGTSAEFYDCFFNNTTFESTYNSSRVSGCSIVSANCLNVVPTVSAVNNYTPPVPLPAPTIEAYIRKYWSNSYDWSYDYYSYSSSADSEAPTRWSNYGIATCFGYRRKSVGAFVFIPAKCYVDCGAVINGDGTREYPSTIQQMYYSNMSNTPGNIPRLISNPSYKQWKIKGTIPLTYPKIFYQGGGGSYIASPTYEDFDQRKYGPWRLLITRATSNPFNVAGGNIGTITFRNGIIESREADLNFACFSSNSSNFMLEDMYILFNGAGTQNYDPMLLNYDPLTLKGSSIMSINMHASSPRLMFNSGGKMISATDCVFGSPNTIEYGTGVTLNNCAVGSANVSALFKNYPNSATCNNVQYGFNNSNWPSYDAPRSSFNYYVLGAGLSASPTV